MDNRINMRLAGPHPATTELFVNLLNDYLETNPLPRDERATIMVAGGPSMVKEDQLPSGSYPGHIWQKINYTYEPAPPDLMDFLNSDDKDYQPEPGDPIHRFQIVKQWTPHDGTNPIGDDTRDAGIAWQIDISDTGFITAILVDQEPYNAAYFFSILGVSLLRLVSNSSLPELEAEGAENG